MKFTKMQGVGNDYVYVNCFNETVKDPVKLSQIVSNRHFGIGSDGLILIKPSEIADFKMSIYNSDGSEAEMCGNGIRCVGKYVYDYNLTDKETIRIETLAGIKILELKINNGKVDKVRVDMGEPILESCKIPVISNNDRFISEPVLIDTINYNITCVSMGNPHAVIYTNDVSSLPLDLLGPKIELNKLFPERINAHFVEVIDKSTLKMRTWERGAKETLACGTGACAVLVASCLNGYTERKANISLPGGTLFIDWNENDNHVYMTGPAVKVFDGYINCE